MDLELLVDRLYENESLADNLEDTDAEHLRQWATSALALCADEMDVGRIFALLRRINDLVGAGVPYRRVRPILDRQRE